MMNVDPLTSTVHFIIDGYKGSVFSSPAVASGRSNLET